MSTLVARALVVGTVAGLGTSLLAGAALAKGGESSEALGSGPSYLLSDTLDFPANRFLLYGDPGDEAYVGDWDGNGTDTLLVRRGNTFYARNSATAGAADVVFSYGNGGNGADNGDEIRVGDWDGNGTDTLAIRRGNTYFIKNSLSGGNADTVITYGNPEDAVLVGDWDGRNGDSLAVRRGNSFLIKNSISTGAADTVIAFGDPGDRVRAGDWDGNGSTTLGVQRGNTYYVRNNLTSGKADKVATYGAPNDLGFVGDWDGNGTDTLGIRRADNPRD